VDAGFRWHDKKMNRIELQPAYILHRRAYRETSFLVELFTQEHGRLTVVAKGVRKPKSSSQGLLQPFVPVLVSWAGKSELMTMMHVEARGENKPLHGECLFAGFYLNELLMGLLQKWDPDPSLFSAYEQTLAKLQQQMLDEKILRSFEKYLLEELGYGLFQKAESANQDAILTDRYYWFVAEQGFVLSDATESSVGVASNLFLGERLLAIAKEDWFDAEVLQDAKRLMRLILMPLLGNRQLHSRKLFV
jgi:DNA repair protein RecO (recombination protein O)